ncbi:hypothetical protein [Bacillus sp. Marseille-P3800]|uniref:hypothetical protein n=1 Tax=Bacillus sp. Marseille-P3800 TaxID=2014782 RepID=UPI000C06F61B|nr:hypothetical protein [Bacillus sp. Marseille-P3800]
MKQFGWVFISGMSFAFVFVLLDLLFLDNPEITVQRVLGAFIGGAVFMLIFYNLTIKRKSRTS